MGANFLLVVLTLVLFLHVLMMLGIIIGLLFRVPYVPSRKKNIISMLKAAQITSQDRVADLGCGDGRILAYASAQMPAATYTGYEIAPIPLFLLHIRKWLWKLPITIKAQSYFKADLSQYSLLLLYLMPETLEALAPKFQKELPKGARIVSNTFPIASLTPSKIYNNTHQEAAIYVYDF